MKSGSARYLICYDVTEDRRRTCLAKHLEGYGDRTQHSVFEAVLDVELAARLVEDIKATIEPKEDRVFVVFLCAACAKRLTRLGTPVDVPGEETVFIA